jgi:hypothetical protein
VFPIAHQLTLSRARTVQSTHSYAISIRSVLILSLRRLPTLKQCSYKMLVSAYQDTRRHNPEKHELGGIKASIRFLIHLTTIMTEVFNSLIHSLGSHFVVIYKNILLLFLSCVSSVTFLDCSHITLYKKV